MTRSPADRLSRWRLVLGSEAEFRHPARWAMILVMSLASLSSAASPRDALISPPSVFGFRLADMDTMDDVVAVLGHAKVVVSGDASEAVSEVCYLLSAASDAMTIVLGSAPEFATIPGQLNQVQFRKVRNGLAPAPCSRISQDMWKARSPALGVHVGMKRAQIARLLGKPQHVVNGREMFTAQRKLRWSSLPSALRAPLESSCMGVQDPEDVLQASAITIEYAGDVAISVTYSSNLAWC